jgi:hypothetical protein
MFAVKLLAGWMKMLTDVINTLVAAKFFLFSAMAAGR